MIEMRDIDNQPEEPISPGDNLDISSAWTISNDTSADWAVRKIAEEREELNRLKSLAEEQIAKIQAKIDAAEKRCLSNTSYLTSKLSEYFATVPHRSTKGKTKETYKLLSGTLTYKFGKPDLKPDNAELVNYLKKSGKNELIKTEEKPMWGEFRKLLSVVDGTVIDTETGEIVECVTVEERPDTFTVDI